MYAEEIKDVVPEMDKNYKSHSPNLLGTHKAIKSKTFLPEESKHEEVNLQMGNSLLNLISKLPFSNLIFG